MKDQLSPGTVVLVGGGLADPDLMTVAGLRAIRQADVIIHDRLGPLDLLAEARPGAELINVGKIPRGAFTPQERINELLIEHARAGRKVVRLKGGDSFVFGRGGEECQACSEAGVPVEVIPGVSSAIAAPELAGIPVTHRTLSQGFTVVSGHVPPGDTRSALDWDALAHTGTTLVILMGVENLGRLTGHLIGAGLAASTPAAVIESAGTPRARALRAGVAEISALAREQNVRPPAVVVIGDVAALDFAHHDPTTGLRNTAS